MVFEEAFAVLNLAFNTVFGPVLVFSPIVSLFVISAFFSILVLLINKIFINTKIVKEIKEKMEAMREQLTAAQKSGNQEDSKKFLDEMMKTNSEYMKHSMKALLISIVIISIFLPWVRYKYSGMTIANLPFALPFLGATLDWFWWYVIVSFAVGWVIKKILSVDYP